MSLHFPDVHRPITRRGAKAIFSRTYPSWSDLEQAITKLDEKYERGDAFEYFSFFYFLHFADLYEIREIYSDKVQGRQIPRDIKKRLRLESKDYGVDGVIVKKDGTLTAYQSKFRSFRTTPTASELATFWAEAEYADERLIIANSYSLPSVAGKKLHHLEVLCDRLEKLPPEFFTAFVQYFRGRQPSRPLPKTPLSYQERCLREISSGFEKVNRGKFIAACGTGKTLMALWDAENSNARNVLFLAPSLLLVRQTLEEWVSNRRIDFDFHCICSDYTVASAVDQGFDEDFADLHPWELDIPVSTEPSRVRRFLSNSSKHRKFVFSTYQSLPVLKDALRSSPVEFDVIYFDEAHRTAGLKQSETFALGLQDSNVPAKRRLFMTATERLIRPWVRERIEEQTGDIIFSMDDVSKYGPMFSGISFGQAIRQNLISDYEVVVAAVSDRPTVSRLERNRYLSLTDEVGTPVLDSPTAAQEIAKAVMLSKVFASGWATKIITYHSTVKVAQQFVKMVEATDFFAAQRQEDLSIQHVNGMVSSHDRAHTISVFENTKLGVLTNVRCLTEGVDLPYISGVMFADPRGSIIDIVQAVGRALRKPYDAPKKKAVIIIPIFIPEGVKDFRSIPGEQFQALHNVVQALRDVDESLADWIDAANLSLAKGIAKIRTAQSSKIRFILPQTVNLRDFSNFISLRIAEINRNPVDLLRRATVLGKHERFSPLDRFFRTLGDYNVDPYESSLVKPTVASFRKSLEANRDKLPRGHNNVSHTEKLGVIVRVDKNRFRLTKLGQLYAKKGISFSDLFANQALLYCEQKGSSKLFPYRAALHVLGKVRSLNRFEFQYGLYLIQESPDMAQEIAAAINRVHLLREAYPNLTQISEANRPKAKDFLDSLHEKCFGEKDIWTDRTTPANQYRYFINHLSLLHPVVEVSSQRVSAIIRASSSKALKQILEISAAPAGRYSEYYGYFLWFPKFKQLFRS